MTPRTPRRAALGALALAATLATAACGTTDPSAAVLLGPQTVPIELLEQQTTARLAAAGQGGAGDRAEVQREVLSRLVIGRLLDRVAAEEGVTVSDADVEATLRRLAGGVETAEEAYRVAQEQAGLDRDAAYRYARVEVLRTRLAASLGPEVGEEQLRQRYQQSIAEFDTVSVRVIPVTDRAVAEQTVTELRADPARFDELARQRAADPSAVGPEPVQVGRGQTPPALDRALFSTPPGEVTLVEEQGTSYVILVVDRQTVPFEEAVTRLREEAAGEGGQQALRDRLAAEAQELGIRVNPRFGEWDAETLQVVPGEPTTSRPARSAQPAPAAPLPTAPGPGGSAPDQPAPDQPAPGAPAPAEPAPR